MTPQRVELAIDPAVIADVVERVLRDELAGRGNWLIPKIALSLTETAAALSIGRTAAYELAKTGELPTITIGTRRVVPVAALEEWVRARTSPAEGLRAVS